MLFKYDKSKNGIIQLEETTFLTEKLMELQNIEPWIRKNPSILSESEEEGIIIIGEQKKRKPDPNLSSERTATLCGAIATRAAI